MATRTRQLSVYLTEEIDFLLGRHRHLTGESASTLMVRLLASYLADRDSVPSSRTAPPGPCRRSLRLDERLMHDVHLHSFESEESATALIRRLLASWCAEND